MSRAAANTANSNNEHYHHHDGMVEDAMNRLVRATIGSAVDPSGAMALSRRIVASHMAVASSTGTSGMSAMGRSHHHHHHSTATATATAAAAPPSPVNAEKLLRRLERTIMQQQQQQQNDDDNAESPRAAFAKIEACYQQLQQLCQNNNNSNGNGDNNDDDGDGWLAREILEVFAALAGNMATTSASATTVKPQQKAAPPATATATAGMNRLPNYHAANENMRNRTQHQQQLQNPSTRTATTPDVVQEQVERAFLESLAQEEESLLRDCLYALQGMPGERIQFTSQWHNNNNNNNNNSINHHHYHHDQSQQHSTRYGGGLFRLHSAAIAFTANDDSQQDTNAEPSASSPSAVVPPQFTRFSKLGSSSVGIGDGLSLCIEAGWLYTRIQSYIQRVRQEAAAAIASQKLDQHQQQATATATTRTPGSIARALTSALDEELQSYQQLLAQLEEETTTGMMASSSTTTTATTSSTTTILGQGYSNLRCLLVSLRMPIQRLKSLAMITDGLETATMTTSAAMTLNRPSGAGDYFHGSNSSGIGPFLLSGLYYHAHEHGDERHGQIVHSLLVAASRPWFEMLYKWTTGGILSDPAHEFFVVSKSSSSNNNNKQHDDNNDCRFLWSNRYRIDKSKIPMGIIDTDLAEPAFKLGKGINFIRHCLLDGEWSLGDLADRARACYAYTPPTRKTIARRHEVEDHEMMGGTTSTLRPTTSTQLTFRSTLTLASQLVNSHILKCIFENHSLVTHLYALKQFLCLGQGDFFSSIMEGLQSEFSTNMIEGRRPGGRGMDGIYRHTLAAIAETALRSTNASNFPPFVLERLQVEMLNTTADSTQKDDKGNKTVWDVFLLEYTVPDPLLPIVHKTAMEDYRMIFLFLFGLKKVEYHLNYMWRQSAVLQHSLHMAAQHKAIQIATSPTYAQANVLLRQIAMTRQSMNHFVVNLKSYLMFEVLEGGWKNLVRDIEEAQTLDQVICAHDQYLHRICRKSLLRPDDEGNCRRSNDDSTSSGLVTLGDRIQELLSMCGEFCDFQEDLFGEALQAAERAAKKRCEAERRLTQGDWGFNSNEEIYDDDTFFGLSDAARLQDLDCISELFNEKIRALIKALNSKLHGGPLVAVQGENYFASVDMATKTTSSSCNELNSPEAQDEHDSLRFLTFQLDQNKFYEPGR